VPVVAKTPDGQTVVVSVLDIDGSAAGLADGETKVAGGLPNLADALKGVDDFTSGLRKALAKVAPDKTTVEISIGFAMESGKLTAMFLDGKAEGSVKVTLEWAKSDKT
jgi:hypothetical protein